jgi:hypothetical protein
VGPGSDLGAQEITWGLPPNAAVEAVSARDQTNHSSAPPRELGIQAHESLDEARPVAHVVWPAAPLSGSYVERDHRSDSRS